MSNLDSDNRITPWHKESYVWLIILFPVLAIIGGIITIVLAIKSNDGLVVDDYYKQGLEINRTLERDHAAVNYALEADIEFKPVTQEVVIHLSAGSGFNYPSELQVSFLSATRAGLDQKISLIQTEEHIYRGNLPALSVGKWYVHIEMDDWRIIKHINI